jgi:hypothetical protein
MVILLNVLIALYSSAYSEITENATDEYLALVSHVRCCSKKCILPKCNVTVIYQYIVVLALGQDILLSRHTTYYSGLSDMPQFSQTALQFVRAPDENVFIPRSYTSSPIYDPNCKAFNLIEIFLLILPLEWWLPHKTYQKINRYIMGVVRTAQPTYLHRLLFRSTPHCCS